MPEWIGDKNRVVWGEGAYGSWGQLWGCQSWRRTVPHFVEVFAIRLSRDLLYPCRRTHWQVGHCFRRKWTATNHFSFKFSLSMPELPSAVPFSSGWQLQLTSPYRFIDLHSCPNLSKHTIFTLFQGLAMWSSCFPVYEFSPSITPWTPPVFLTFFSTQTKTPRVMLSLFSHYRDGWRILHG